MAPSKRFIPVSNGSRVSSVNRTSASVAPLAPTASWVALFRAGCAAIMAVHRVAMGNSSRAVATRILSSRAHGNPRAAKRATSAREILCPHTYVRFDKACSRVMAIPLTACSASIRVRDWAYSTQAFCSAVWVADAASRTLPPAATASRRYRAIAKSPTITPPPSAVPIMGAGTRWSAVTERSTSISVRQATARATTGRSRMLAALGFDTSCNGLSLNLERSMMRGAPLAGLEGAAAAAAVAAVAVAAAATGAVAVAVGAAAAPVFKPALCAAFLAAFSAFLAAFFAAFSAEATWLACASPSFFFSFFPFSPWVFPSTPIPLFMPANFSLSAKSFVTSGPVTFLASSLSAISFFALLMLLPTDSISALSALNVSAILVVADCPPFFSTDESGKMLSMLVSCLWVLPYRIV
mmetsp:Transcript_793/g.1938  ORF Transcript_793/g.1938 Transcript_793/m.1938 type:complete len:410 (+) Transcript_793:2482-3711(+)